MAREKYAKPFNISKGYRDTARFLPEKETGELRCPEEDRPFEKYSIIDRTDRDQIGVREFYCPVCDALVMLEHVSPDRHKTEIIDPSHI